MTFTDGFSPHVFSREAEAFLSAALRLGPDRASDRPDEDVRSAAWFCLGHSVELSLKVLIAARTSEDPPRWHALVKLAGNALTRADCHRLGRATARRVRCRELIELRRRFPAPDRLNLVFRRDEPMRTQRRPISALLVLRAMDAVHGQAVGGASPYRTRYARLGVIAYPLWKDALALAEQLAFEAAVGAETTSCR